MGKSKEFYRKQNDELVTHVAKVKQEDNEESFNIVIAKLKGYMTSVTSKFFISGFSNDDIYQECLIALRFKAISDYNENKGPFIKFAKLCIRRHIITELKACKKKKNMALNSAISLDVGYDNDSDGDGDYSCSLMDFIEDKPDKDRFEILNMQERGRMMYNILSRRLTKLEYKVLVYYLKGYNYTEIVNILEGDETLPHNDDIGSNKKVVDNALCRVKKKAFELSAEIEEDGSVQTDMFMDLTQEIN
jgi:RNA polymerase sporulation-specific sigma factor